MPALTEEQLDRRVLREFGGKSEPAVLKTLWTVSSCKAPPGDCCALRDPPEKKVNEITREDVTGSFV